MHPWMASGVLHHTGGYGGYNRHHHHHSSRRHHRGTNPHGGHRRPRRSLWDDLSDDDDDSDENDEIAWSEDEANFGRDLYRHQQERGHARTRARPGRPTHLEYTRAVSPRSGRLIAVWQGNDGRMYNARQAWRLHRADPEINITDPDLVLFGHIAPENDYVFEDHRTGDLYGVDSRGRPVHGRYIHSDHHHQHHHLHQYQRRLDVRPAAPSDAGLLHSPVNNPAGQPQRQHHRHAQLAHRPGHRAHPVGPRGANANSSETGTGVTGALDANTGALVIHNGEGGNASAGRGRGEGVDTFDLGHDAGSAMPPNSGNGGGEGGRGRHGRARRHRAAPADDNDANNVGPVGG